MSQTLCILSKTSNFVFIDLGSLHLTQILHPRKLTPMYSNFWRKREDKSLNSQCLSIKMTFNWAKPSKLTSQIHKKSTFKLNIHTMAFGQKFHGHKMVMLGVVAWIKMKMEKDASKKSLTIISLTFPPLLTHEVQCF